MTPSLLSIAAATLVSEDLTCIAVGVLIAQNRLGLVEGTLACLVGILSGDILLFLAGRFAGRPFLRRWIGERKLQSASDWIARRGLGVVLASRFTPGLRLPAYVAAGMLRSRFWVFAGYFLLASALWTPLLVAGTATLGEHTLRGALGGSPLVVFAIVAGTFACRAMVRLESRQRAVAFVKRILQWEFWPPWAVYLPLAPYFVFLAARYRSPTLFTAANPGIFAGGLTGESKSATLRHLARVDGAVPEFLLIPSALSAEARIEAARGFVCPAVLKPDVGQRGSGVSIVRTNRELEDALREAAGDMILQRYVPGEEFGVYYVRYPGETRGRVLSVTRKRFPFVTGDGASSLRDLILRDSRAVCLADAYFRAARRCLDDVPAAGERVPLVEIGSHCRGAVFEDASHLVTPELTDAIGRVSQAHPGFHLGRYDVRSASAAALSRGEFQVIELNGVAAEPAHVYDPAVSLPDAYRTLARHWRMAFEIGAMNRAEGCVPMTVAGLLRLLLPARAAWRPHLNLNQC